MTSIRARKHFDVERLREAIAGPGADPRFWVSSGRVISDGTRWDPEVGPIVDVSLNSGEATGVELTARVGTTVSGDGYGEFTPLEEDQEVLVVLPDGDPESDPIVLAYLSNEGSPVFGEVAGITPGDPLDQELKKSPYGRAEEYDGDHTLKAANVSQIAGENAEIYAQQAATLKADLQAIVEAPLVSLGSSGAAEPYVLGTAFTTAQSALWSSLQADLVSLAVASKLATNAADALTKLTYPAKLIEYDAKLLVPGQLLSDKINGE